MGANPTGLPDLARRINEEDAAARRLMKEAVAHTVEAGRLLIEAKGQVPPGVWKQWVAENLTFDVRRAKNCMTVYEKRDEEEFKF
jgi:hypothetical protein